MKIGDFGISRVFANTMDLAISVVSNLSLCGMLVNEYTLASPWLGQPGNRGYISYDFRMFSVDYPTAYGHPATVPGMLG